MGKELPGDGFASLFFMLANDGAERHREREGGSDRKEGGRGREKVCTLPRDGQTRSIYFFSFSLGKCSSSH